MKRASEVGSVDRLGYVANQQARSLAGGKTRMIGLLVPGLDNGYVGEIARGVDEELARVHYEMVLYTTHRNEAKETSYAGKIARGLADGLLLVVPVITSEYLEALREREFPYILIDQTDPANQSSVVDGTNWQGAYDATQYLIKLGHRRIGFIAGLMTLNSAVERLEGYKAALLDHRIPFDPALVAEGDFLQPAGRSATHQLLDLLQRPTAIFASNDLSAFGAMEAIRDRGLDIPRDISLIGFDDIPQASLVFPQLTTVRQPLDQMGRVAARMLIDEIDYPRHMPRRVTLSTSLIVRDSCRSPT
jgi:LacI family transcriptional regulator